MGTTTTRQTLTSAAYTNLGTGISNIFVKVLTATAIRFYIGPETVAPDPALANYMPLASAPLSISNLSAGDNVWARAEDLDADVVVIKG